MDSLILTTTIIAALGIIALNIFLYRRQISEKLDLHILWASRFSKSIFLTFLAIIFIYVAGFSVEAFNNPTMNAMIFFSTLGAMILSVIGMALKKRWFLFLWLGIVISSLIITILQIDPFTIPLPIYSLVIMGLIWVNLHYYNDEKNEFFYQNH